MSDDLQPGDPAGPAEIRAEMSKVNSGSKREAELNARLEAFYRAKFPEPAPARPDGYNPVAMPDALAPDTAAFAETNVRSERLAQLKGELEMVLLPGDRRAALEAERDDLLRGDFEAQQSHAPEAGPTPTTVTFAEGTEEPVKNAFCALALEHNVPRSEAQTVLDSLKAARWLTPEQFRAELAAEWGDQYAALAALADRTLEQLPFRLRDAVLARESNDTRFSPEVARALVAFAKRQRGGR